MALQVFEADEFERAVVGAFQDDRWGQIGLQSLPPAQGADAPAVAGLESGKAPLGLGCDEVIAHSQLELQKLGCHARADQVRADVAFVGLAAAVAEVSRQGVVRAGHQIGAQDIACFHAAVMGLAAGAPLSAQAAWQISRHAMAAGARGVCGLVGLARLSLLISVHSALFHPLWGPRGHCHEISLPDRHH